MLEFYFGCLGTDGCFVFLVCVFRHELLQRYSYISCPHRLLIGFLSMWGDVLLRFTVRPCVNSQLEQKRFEFAGKALVVTVSQMKYFFLLCLCLFLCRLKRQRQKPASPPSACSSSCQPLSSGGKRGQSAFAATEERWLTVTLELSPKSGKTLILLGHEVVWIFAEVRQ